MLVDCMWPAWEWGPCDMAHLRYVAFSYSASLTERDNERFRDLVISQQYQELWGKRVRVVKVGSTQISNGQKGWKLASSVGGVATGARGDRIILDDPHNIIEAESEIVRNETTRWFRESMSNRLNNMETGAIVIIMQRVHEDDISGVVLSAGLNYVHLCIPMEFESSRWFDDNGTLVPNEYGWVDPRLDEDDLDECEGELAWPERFTAEVVAQIKHDMGPYASAAQYQQSPAPRGGGIFKRQWWQLWESKDNRFPAFEYLIGSLDSAFTQKEENDPSALVILGIFKNEMAQRRIMLVHAWRKHLEFSGPRMEQLPRESKEAYRRRTMPSWGLLEWVQDTCTRFKVDKLLIEAKANGISAAQELRNRYGLQDWSIQLCPAKGDKVARALAVQATFSQEMVYAPSRDWSDDVISEMAVFPKGKHDDLTDAMTQAVKHLRDTGMAQTDQEVTHAEMQGVMHRPKMQPLYPV